MAAYRPHDIDPSRWAELAPVVADWVQRTPLRGLRRTRRLLYAATHLAAWAAAEHIPVRADTALRDTTIERFCAVAERDGRYSRSTRATIRSELRFLAVAVGSRDVVERPPLLRRGKVKPPYSDAEVTAYWQLVANQSRIGIRRQLEGMLAAGLGAGCGPIELRQLHGPDITTSTSGGVVVTVAGGTPRRTVCLDRYAKQLLAAAAAAGDGLLIGVRADRHNVTSRLLGRIEGGADLPPIEATRLRTTWMATHLRFGTRLDVLMAAAGLTTPTSIVDVARHLPPVPDVDAVDQLRGAQQ